MSISALIPSEWFSVKRTKELFDERISAGFPVCCPVCDHTSRCYPRSLYGQPVRELIELYKIGGLNFRHISDFKENKTGGGDFSKLLLWGLIKPMPSKEEEEKEKRSSGFWKITPKGVQFIIGELALPKVAVEYRSKLQFHDGDKVYIADVVGDNFNYRELMSVDVMAGGRVEW